MGGQVLATYTAHCDDGLCDLGSFNYECSFCLRKVTDCGETAIGALYINPPWYTFCPECNMPIIIWGLE